MVEHYSENIVLDLTYAALASPTRRAILQSLREEQTRVTDLARRFPTSLATVSKHIQVLERAGLVHREIRGRDHYLSADPSNLADAERWIAEYTSFWGRGADSLVQHLKDFSTERSVPSPSAQPPPVPGAGVPTPPDPGA